jgi:hypothetical protein
MKILQVLCLLIVSLFFLFFKLKISENFESGKVFVLSYENEVNNVHKKDLENKLKYYGYDYKFIGEGDEWKGFGTKIKAYQNFIRETNLNDNDILIILDSRDIYVNRNSNQISKVFEELYEKRGGDLDKNLKLVFSSEMGCCTRGIDDINKEKMKNIGLEYPKMKKVDGNYYLNSGMVIGYVKAFKEIYLNFNIDLTDDDQTKITNFWLDNNLNQIILDYDQVLFSNAHKWGNKDNLNGCFYEKKESHDNEFMIKDTTTFPFFIQTPGKYWTCYNYLYEKKSN